MQCQHSFDDHGSDDAPARLSRRVPRILELTPGDSSYLDQLLHSAAKRKQPRDVDIAREAHCRRDPESFAATLSQTAHDRWGRPSDAVPARVAQRLSVCQVVDELFERSENSRRALYFRRGSGLFTMRLRHQQRPALVEGDQSRTRRKDGDAGERLSEGRFHRRKVPTSPGAYPLDCSAGTEERPGANRQVRSHCADARTSIAKHRKFQVESLGAWPALIQVFRAK